VVELAVTSGQEINHLSCDLLRVGSNDFKKNIYIYYNLKINFILKVRLVLPCKASAHKPSQVIKGMAQCENYNVALEGSNSGVKGEL
jgi:hypothetical protein